MKGQLIRRQKVIRFQYHISGAWGNVVLFLLHCWHISRALWTIAVSYDHLWNGTLDDHLLQTVILMKYGISLVQVCGCSLAGIAGSNPAGSIWRLSLVNVVCQVEASAKGRSSYRGVLPSVYVSLYFTSCNRNPLHLQWVGRRGQTKQDRQCT